MNQLDPRQAGVCDETLALLRRLRVEYRRRPVIYRDLLWLTGIAGSASGTELDHEGTPPPGLILSAQEAADLAGLTPRTIRRACREKRLTATKHGRDWTISRSDLAEWLARRAA